MLAQLEQSRADSLILGENNQACSVLLRAKEETLTRQETAIKDLEQFQALSNKLVLDMEGEVNQLQMVIRNCDSNTSPAIFTSKSQGKAPIDNIEGMNIREQENAKRTMEKNIKIEANTKTKANNHKGKGFRKNYNFDKDRKGRMHSVEPVGRKKYSKW